MLAFKCSARAPESLLWSLGFHREAAVFKECPRIYPRELMRHPKESDFPADPKDQQDMGCPRPL